MLRKHKDSHIDSSARAQTVSLPLKQPERALEPQQACLTAFQRVTRGVVLDLSRFRAAPGARLGHLAFESDGAFPTEC